MRIAALAMATSALVLVALIDRAAPYVLAVGSAVTAMAMLSAVALWHDDRIETRVTAGITALTTAAGAVAVSTVGLPGAVARPVDVATVALVVLSLLVPALLVSDRVQRRPTPAPGPSYAL